MFKHESTFLIADHHVWKHFVADIAGDYLRADAGIIIDKLRNELRVL